MSCTKKLFVPIYIIVIKFLWHETFNFADNAYNVRGPVNMPLALEILGFHEDPYRWEVKQYLIKHKNKNHI